MDRTKDKKYTLDQLVESCDVSAPYDDPMSDISDADWPPEEASEPYAYRVVDWRGKHVVVVRSRDRAYEIQSQSDIDPRLNTIYAIFQDETEKCIQGGLSFLDNLDGGDFEVYWTTAMRKMNISEDDIETTLSYYRRQQSKLDLIENGL